MMQTVKTLVKSSLPADHLDRLEYAKAYVASLRYAGLRFCCPVCGGHFRAFLPAGVEQRRNAMCPRCFSLERHRLIWKYLEARTRFFEANLRVLHVAPEYCFQGIFASLPNLEYVSVDLGSPLAMVQVDITSIAFDSSTFDCILCSHVLEHIPDDRQAMRELYRILRPNGWAILQVPIERETTYEDPKITSPEQRLKYFGKEDHVRVYGLDYKDRLEHAGFTVSVDAYLSELGEGIVDRYRLMPEDGPEEDLYFCSKLE
jgi:SAM-dependent methyltransferase